MNQAIATPTALKGARSLRCCCCGSDAGRWLQWHNQDTGWGLCSECAARIPSRLAFGRPTEMADPMEFCRTYGLPGRNFAPTRSIVSWGRFFVVVATFPDTEEGADAANAFMLHFGEVGVLEVKDGEVFLAHRGDSGSDIDPCAA